LYKEKAAWRKPRGAGRFEKNLVRDRDEYRMSSL